MRKNRLKILSIATLFSALTLLSACQDNIVVVQRCHALPDPQWKTVKELYLDDAFVRAYLKECTAEK